MKLQRLGKGWTQRNSRRRGSVMIALMVVAVALLAVLTIVSILGLMNQNQNQGGSSNTPDITAVDQAGETAKDTLGEARQAMQEAEQSYEAATAAKLALEERGQSRYDTQVDRQGLETELADLGEGDDPAELQGRLDESLSTEGTAISDEDAAFLAYESAVEDFRNSLAAALVKIDAAEAAAQTYEDRQLDLERSATDAAADQNDPNASAAAAPITTSGGDLLDEVAPLRARWSELNALAESEFPPGSELVPDRIDRSEAAPENPELDTTVYLVVAAVVRAEDGPFQGQWVFVGAPDDGFAVLSYDEETETRSSRQVAKESKEGIRNRYPEHRILVIELTNQDEAPEPEAGQPVASLDDRIDIDALAAASEE